VEKYTSNVLQCDLVEILFMALLAFLSLVPLFLYGDTCTVLIFTFWFIVPQCRDRLLARIVNHLSNLLQN